MAVLWEFADSIDDVENKEEWEKFGDGYRRKVEVEDVSGLKSALKKEREARKQFEREMGKYKDIDPEKYKELLEKHGDKMTDIEKLQRGSQRWRRKPGRGKARPNSSNRT
jgi:hypothetical protein